MTACALISKGLFAQGVAAGADFERRLSVLEANAGLTILVFGGFVVIVCGCAALLWKEVSVGKHHAHQVGLKLEEMNGNMKVQNAKTEDLQSLIRSITSTTFKTTPKPAAHEIPGP